MFTQWICLSGMASFQKRFLYTEPGNRAHYMHKYCVLLQTLILKFFLFKFIISKFFKLLRSVHSVVLNNKCFHLFFFLFELWLIVLVALRRTRSKRNTTTVYTHFCTVKVSVGLLKTNTDQTCTNLASTTGVSLP